MINCVAPWCRNSSCKGFKMNYFPRKKKRRNAWIKNINRTNWIPKRNSALCEAHFAPNMWIETRIGGQKKLKSCAIPTIFVRNKNTHLPLKEKRNGNNEIIVRINIFKSITLLQRKHSIHIQKGDESQSECNEKSYRSKETNSKQITDNIKILYENNVEGNTSKEKRIEKKISETLSEGVKTISNSTNKRYLLKITINRIYKTH